MSLSHEKKLELVQSITIENFFRTEVIIPLFLKMGKFVQVFDNHGPNEKGTDVVLVEDGTFSGYRYTSVILKTVPISNSTDTKKDRETAANVVNQIVLATNAGYQCNLVRRRVAFNSVLVITTQTISNTAQESFNNTSNMHGMNDISYLQQSDLVTAQG